MTRRAILALALALGAVGPGACAAVEPAREPGALLLVTVPQSTFDRAAPPLGSSQGYRAVRSWDAPVDVRRTLRQIVRSYRLAEVDGWPIESLGRYCAVVRLAPGDDVETVVAALRDDPRVVDAQMMQHFAGMLSDGYDDPQFQLQYGPYADALAELHRWSTGRGVRVGIVDTPVDLHHPDLVGQIHRQHRFVDSRIGSHGTAVAGIIAAAVNNGTGVVGISPDARIEVFGACDETEGRARCSSFDLAKALEHAVQRRMDVINMSLTGPHDRLLADLIAVATQRGALVVAAADETPGRGFPASLPEVVAVAPSADATQWFRREEQLSTLAGGGYRFFRGSSIAAAGVSGLAALVRAEVDDGATRGFIETLMRGECSRRTPEGPVPAVLVGRCERPVAVNR